MSKKETDEGRRLKLFSNKKGQLADILGGFQRVISWFIDVVPKPIKVLIFLLFILLLGSLFGFFLNSTGNWCDTAGNEYSTGVFSLFTNVDLLVNQPSNDELNTEEIDPNDENFFDSTIVKCSRYFDTFDDYYLRYENGTKVLLQDDQYFFHDTGRCTSCSEKVKIWADGNSLLSEDYCLDDIIYPKSYDELSWLGKVTCGKFLGSCDIPEGYYYDRNLNLFICDDPLCQSENGSVSTIGERWNLLLREKGAKLKAPSVYGDKDYRNALSIECDAGDVSPKFRLFGIEVFSYKIWVFLFVLGALLWALFKIKGR